MREGDAAFEALRAAIDELAAREAPGLIAEARAEARAKVRSILAEAIAQALLEQSNKALSGEDFEVPVEPAGPVAARPAAPQAPEAPVEAPGEPPPAEQMPSSTAVGPASEASDTEIAPDPPRGWYVYCVVAADSLTIPETLDGVDAGRPVVEIAQSGIAALASRVSLTEFGEERLRENLNDVSWLEDTARTHEQVLETALAETTVIPMRLCTVYASEQSVREMLERERAVLVDALARLEGRTEWGVKVFVDREALEEAAAERNEELRTLRAEVGGLSEGEAYMKRKQLDTLVTEEADVLADACVDDVHARLSERASEALLNPLQRPEVSGRSGEMLLNGVYLVEDVSAETFHAAVDELGGDYGPLGFVVELTGPWPPYNFVKNSIEAAR